MLPDIDNWKTQVRKGYLELCVLSLIQAKDRLYGFEMLEILDKSGLPLKEGTLYPLLNRMTSEGTLKSSWEMQDGKGHPRKFYELTKEGRRLLEEMQGEFERMNQTYKKLYRRGEER